MFLAAVALCSLFEILNLTNRSDCMSFVNFITDVKRLLLILGPLRSPQAEVSGSTFGNLSITA